jgi:secreted trypsin-like serine protease
MRRLVVIVVLACAALVPSAGAVTTNGFPDNGLHPMVGAIMVPARVQPPTGPTAYAEVCSGTLISPRVFLTASHCTSYLEGLAAQNPPRPSYVTFDETDIEPYPDGLIPATPRTNPAYKWPQADVSAMILATPVTTVPTSGVPTSVGQFDSLAKGTPLTVVGYGTSEQCIPNSQGAHPCGDEFADEKGPQFPFEGDRGYGIGALATLTPQWLIMSQNEALGSSGACYGDSGGPTFRGAAPNDDKSLVLAVTSTGDIPCYSTNVTSRTDTPSAQAFFAQLRTEGLLP